MRCPFCSCIDTQVKDSRGADDYSTIRRRRECPECGSRFTTFERVQLRELVIVKKDGSKVPFDREKMARSIYVAVSKRPVDPEHVEKVINSIQRRLETSGETEIPSIVIGEYVMNGLLTLDHIAYIRFASVYKDFREVKDFEEFVDNIEK